MRSLSGRRVIGLAFAILFSVRAATPLAAAVDSDGDGFGEPADCNDQNDQVWAPPGEALQLRFSSKTTLIWSSPQILGGTSGSLRFDTLKSTSASNFAAAPPGSCLDPEGLTASSTDTASPPVGTVYFYLVRAKNGCGGGSLGDSSNGMPRVGIACDCSALCSDGLTCTRDFCVDGGCAHAPIPPAIQAQPQAVAVCAGDDAHFSVRASGQGTLHYQWQLDGANVGNDSPAHVLQGAKDGAELGCIVTDSCGSATTTAAVLTVFSSAASCSGGGSGQEAPNGASGYPFDPDVRDRVAETLGSVYRFSGEYYLEATDLEIQGRGFDFEWTRKYRSREDRLTRLGHNWDFSYNRFVTQDLPGTDMIVADGNSRRDRYQLGPIGCWTAPGFFRELCPQPDGTLVLTFPNKTTWKFKALDGGAAEGKIEEIRDRNDNAMTFSYDPGGRLAVVTDTLGRNVTVSYDSDGFISGVTDFTGRHVAYTYYGSLEAEGLPGDLESVTTPAVTGTPTDNNFPNGKTTIFRYAVYPGVEELSHNLLTITDPSGRVILHNTYTTALSPADPRFDRLDRQTFPNGTLDYVYVPVMDPGSDAVTKTIVNDRAGHVQESFFNALNQMVMLREYTGTAPSPNLPSDDSLNRTVGQLRPTDPAYFETRWTWSADSLLSSVVLPEGNSIAYTYDSGNPDVRLRANVLQRVSNPGPRGGDQPSITESWTYATSFGDEPCVCRGCCGEGGGGGLESWYLIRGDCTCREGPYGFESSYLIRGDCTCREGPYGFQRKEADKALPRTEVVKNIWKHSSRTTIGKGLYEWIKGVYAASHQDGRGNISVQSIDPATGNVLQVTGPEVTTGVLGGGTQTITESWQYNAYGQATSHTNPTGSVDEYTYYTSGPATGYLEDITIDAPGPLPGSGLALLTITARDAVGNITAVTDPNGNTETFVYNQLDQLVRRIAKPPFGYQTDSCYDVNDRLASIDVQNVDEAGVLQPNASISTTYFYDSLGHVLRVRLDPDTLDVTTEYQYDAHGRVTLRRLPEAVNGHQPTNRVRTLRDERGLVYRVIDAEGDPAAATTQWDYDGNGNVVAIREGLEATPSVTTLAYDGYDRLIGSIDAMGNVTTRHYDANGNPTSVEIVGELVDGESGPNVLLSAVVTTNDEIDRPVQTEVAFFETATGAPIGDGVSTTRTFYDASSRVIRSEDDNGHGTDTAYDGAGRVAALHDSKGNTTTYGYDPNGNVLTVTEVELSDLPTPPEVFVTTSTFDTLDRASSTTSPAGQLHTFAWDSRGNQTVHIDARGNETRSFYDAMSRLTATQRKMTDTGEGGGTVSYVLDQTRSYDADSRLTQQVDDNANATTYQYDPLGRLVATIHADGTAELRSYDAHGSLVSLVDANGSVTSATFDARRRLKTRSISRAPGVLGTTSETWKYDGLSRIVHAENDGSVVTRAYDSLSNVTEESLAIGAGPTRSLSATFDAVGNRAWVTYPSGLTTAMTYDSLDLVRTLTLGGLGSCSGGLHPGQTCLSNNDCIPDGTCTPLGSQVTSYDYAGPGRVFRRINANGTQTTYAHDAARRVTRTTHVKLVPYAEIDDRVYAWDPMDNKTSRSQLQLLGSGTVHDYSYDSAGQMTEATWLPPGAPPVITSYSLDGAGNRVLVSGGAEPGPYSMSSVLPEPADQPVNQYTSTPFDGSRGYDRNGNLVTKPGAGESMSYDYRNQMVAFQGPLGPATYQYDAFGRRIVADGKEYLHDEQQEVEERSAAGALTAAYVHGRDLDEVSLALADVTGDGLLDRSYPLTDDLGNVVAMTNENGDPLEHYDYGDFGLPRFFDPGGSPIADSAIDNQILFNGHRYETKTGLYHYRTRYLDPRAGRFTTRDGTGAWGDPGNLGNGYSYAGNTPWTNVDPTGTVAVKTGMNRKGISISPHGMVRLENGRGGGGGGGGEGGISKWECIWSGGTWIYDWSLGGFCMKPLSSAQIVAGPDPGAGDGQTKGKVKFFNEKKGFGFRGVAAKLCPGHISCPGAGGGSPLSLAGPGIGAGGGGPLGYHIEFCYHSDGNLLNPSSLVCCIGTVSGTNVSLSCTTALEWVGDILH